MLTKYGSLIKKHNNRNLSPINECDKCDCNSVSDCPVGGKCQQTNIIYQATINTSKNETHTYTGLSMNSFKARWTQHMSDFRNISSKAKTTLSKKVWQLKSENVAFNVTWKLKCRSTPYTPANKSCNLCTSEIFHILFYPHDASLNSRNELKGYCRHWEKHKLGNFKT